MSELIANLPAEKKPVDEREKYILENYFPTLSDPQTKSRLYLFKDSIIGALLLGFLSLPFVSDLIYKIFPVTENNLYYLLIVKMVIFVFAFFFLTNFNLLKK